MQQDNSYTNNTELLKNWDISAYIDTTYQEQCHQFLDIVEDDEALPAGGHEGGHVPLVELVHHLEVHVRRPEG